MIKTKQGEITKTYFIPDSNDEEVNFALKAAETISNIVVKIRETRIEKWITRKQVAEMAGITERTLANLENLRSIPTIDTVIRVATVLGLKLEIR